LGSLESGGYDSECIGGGRITHEAKKITVFGYSQVIQIKINYLINYLILIDFQGFGKADHSISVDVLKQHYPPDYKITWNDDGY
jgi:phosphohistidine phosphatase